MKSDQVNVIDLMRTLWKYKISMVLITLITFTFAIQLTFWMEKSYKSGFEFNIFPQFFQSPLVMQMIPGGYSEAEMRATIDAMVKEALNDRFLDRVGKKFKIYPKKMDQNTLAKERQLLRERFAYYPGTGLSYQVNFFHSDPMLAKKIAEFSMERIRQHFINDRLQTIELVKVIMKGQMNSVQGSLRKNDTKKNTREESAFYSKSPSVLRGELKKVNDQIALLSQELGSEHPRMIKLSEHKHQLTQWLSHAKQEQEERDNIPVSVNSDLELMGQNTVDSFFGKYQEMMLALDIERNSLGRFFGITLAPQLSTAPVSPKKRIFATVGFVLGMVFAFLFVFFQELVLPNSREELERTSTRLNTMILGYLPQIKEEQLKLSEVTHDPCFN